MKNRLLILDTNIFSNKDIYDYWYNKMPLIRKNKIDKYVFDEDKKLSLGAGVLLNKINIINKTIVYNENDKPYVNDNSIYFNISHSDNLVACAISDKEIGVDIESIKEFSFDLINNVYNYEEIDFIKETKDFSLYTKLWTMKESYMKYLGTGLSMDAKAIHIDLLNNKCLNANNVFFKSIKIKNYYLTVCSEYNDFPNELEWFEE